jgi:ATP-binding cassette subfamily C protein CydC
MTSFGPGRRHGFRAAGDAAARWIGALGLTLTVVAEAASVGLLGLSGWFITSAAVAGAAVYSTFSYLAPSGGVRAFALTRIASNYGARLALHTAALGRLSHARLALYDAAAASDRRALHDLRDGEALDRTIRDAETVSESQISWQSPLLTAALCTAGVVAVAWSLDAPAGLALLATTAAVAVAATWFESGAHSADESLSAVRGAVVQAVDSWGEMASLGATGTLRAQVLEQLERHTRQLRDSRMHEASADAALGMISVVGLTTMLAAAAADQVAAPSLVLLALLAIGTLESLSRIGGTLRLRRSSVRARRRIADAFRSARARHAPLEPGSITVTTPGTGSGAVRVSEYRLPESVHGPSSRVSFTVRAGETLLLRGSSGIGKTTLLESIADSVRTTSTTISVSGDDLDRPHVLLVPSDDHLFTGTVASNLRLGCPELDHDAMTSILRDLQLDRSGITPGTRIGVGGRALSGGEQVRLRLARAIAAHPDVLLLDEPTTGLDAATSSEALMAIRRRLPAAVLVLTVHGGDRFTHGLEIRSQRLGELRA